MLKNKSAKRKHNLFEEMSPERIEEFEMYIKSQKETEKDSVKSHGKDDTDNNGEVSRESFDESSYAGLGTTEFEMSEGSEITDNLGNTINVPLRRMG